ALDAGDVLASKALPIKEHTTESLLEILSKEGAALLPKVIDQLLHGRETAQPQDESLVTYARLLKKEDGYADFEMDAQTVLRRSRAFSRQPGYRALWLPQNL